MTSFQTFGGHQHHAGGGEVPGQGVATNTVQTITAHEAVEVAGRNVEKMIHSDNQFPSLTEKLRIGKQYYKLLVMAFSLKLCSRSSWWSGNPERSPRTRLSINGRCWTVRHIVKPEERDAKGSLATRACGALRSHAMQLHDRPLPRA